MNLFRIVPLRRPRRNFFDLSHEVKTSCMMGQLIPFFIHPTVPGDKFKMQSEILLRLAPTLAPIMHRVDVFTHFFFVPNRLIWDEWEAFVTKGTTGKLVPKSPQIKASLVDVGPNSLACHLGWPVQNLDSSKNGTSEKNPGVNDYHYITELPFRGYQLIYDEYYRDQNLQVPLFKRTFDREGSPSGAGDSPQIPMSSGLNSDPWRCRELTTIRNRAWEKDYFTSALPFQQRGNPVELQLFNGQGGSLSYKSDLATEFEYADGTVGNPSGNLSLDTGSTKVSVTNPAGTKDVRMNLDNIEIDLPAESVTIDSLRRSFKLQEFLERDSRGGGRYVESILSHFGVRSSDARMQRPIYLGGGKSPVIVSEVVQTSASSAGSPQGNMSGHGVSAQVTHKWKHFFEEHGFIFGILSVMPKPAYMNGTPRIFLKEDVYDYYWPEFAHLGEQRIEEKEIYTQWGHSHDNINNTKTFGYTPRYSEYKFIPSSVSGDMAKSLDFWHLARNFTSPPNLNGNFVSHGIPQDRIFAVNDGTDNCWIQIYNKVHAKRPMPKFGVPRM